MGEKGWDAGWDVTTESPLRGSVALISHTPGSMRSAYGYAHHHRGLSTDTPLRGSVDSLRLRREGGALRGSVASLRLRREKRRAPRLRRVSAPAARKEARSAAPTQLCACGEKGGDGAHEVGDAVPNRLRWRAEPKAELSELADYCSFTNEPPEAAMPW